MGVRHIVVTGLMATGKSTVGRALAARLGLPYVDNDELLETRVGATAAEVQARSSADELHRLEADVLRKALERRQRSVIGAAASVIEDEDARRALEAHDVVWLRASPEVLARRANAGDDHRPGRGPELLALLRAQDARRGPLFARAAMLALDSSAASPAELAAQVMAQLGTPPACSPGPAPPG